MTLLIGTREAGEMLGSVVSKNRLYGWILAGVLPSVKCGGRYFIARTSVEALVERIARGEWPSEDDA